MPLPKPFKDFIELRQVLLKQNFALARLRPQVIAKDDQPAVKAFLQTLLRRDPFADVEPSNGYFYGLPWVFEGAEATLQIEADILRARVAALQAEVDNLRKVTVTVRVDGD